ncbi:hypothetical protein [Streptomyces sp. NBC_01012]|uniref:hypothetical protein n=1 Tax=Streptomyces sp. NBC_01012 TaxID=2903717 RepID=UPI00386F35B9|nr:hypothetical protein OG623_27975 [Streptomyces sp. NBC_01012]
MSAPTHTQTRRATDAVDVRLPWWAVALPGLAFAALLLLIMDPGQAHAAAGGSSIGGSAIVQLLGHILGLMPA